MTETIQKLKTGTTTVGLLGKDVVVLAADRRATMGYLKASSEAEKVHKIDDRIGLTIAGSVGDAQQLIRVMRAQLKLYKLETGELSVKGATTLLSNILHSNRYYPFFNQFILGGVTNGTASLYDLDPVGGSVHHTKFASSGSGSPSAYGVLEDAYKEDMTEEETVGIAIRAIKAASKRDIASGDGVDVAVITSSGYKKLTPEEVEAHL